MNKQVEVKVHEDFISYFHGALLKAGLAKLAPVLKECDEFIKNVQSKRKGSTRNKSKNTIQPLPPIDELSAIEHFETLTKHENTVTNGLRRSRRRKGINESASDSDGPIHNLTNVCDSDNVFKKPKRPLTRRQAKQTASDTMQDSPHNDSTKPVNPENENQISSVPITRAQSKRSHQISNTTTEDESVQMNFSEPDRKRAKTDDDVKEVSEKKEDNPNYKSPVPPELNELVKLNTPGASKLTQITSDKEKVNNDTPDTEPEICPLSPILKSTENTKNIQDNQGTEDLADSVASKEPVQQKTRNQRTTRTRTKQKSDISTIQNIPSEVTVPSEVSRTTRTRTKQKCDISTIQNIPSEVTVPSEVSSSTPKRINEDLSVMNISSHNDALSASSNGVGKPLKRGANLANESHLELNLVSPILTKKIEKSKVVNSPCLEITKTNTQSFGKDCVLPSANTNQLCGKDNGAVDIPETTASTRTKTLKNQTFTFSDKDDMNINANSIVPVGGQRITRTRAKEREKKEVGTTLTSQSLTSEKENLNINKNEVCLNTPKASKQSQIIFDKEKLDNDDPDVLKSKEKTQNIQDNLDTKEADSIVSKEPVKQKTRTKRTTRTCTKQKCAVSTVQNIPSEVSLPLEVLSSTPIRIIVDLPVMNVASHSDNPSASSDGLGKPLKQGSNSANDSHLALNSMSPILSKVTKKFKLDNSSCIEIPKTNPKSPGKSLVLPTTSPSQLSVSNNAAIDNPVATASTCTKTLKNPTFTFSDKVDVKRNADGDVPAGSQRITRTRAKEEKVKKEVETTATSQTLTSEKENLNILVQNINTNSTPCISSSVNSAVKSNTPFKPSQESKKAHVFYQAFSGKVKLKTGLTDELKSKRKEKMQKVTEKKIAAEKQKLERLKMMQQQKEEKERLAKAEREKQKMEEAAMKKKMLALKLQVAEERRVKEERERLAKLKQQEEEQKKLAAQRQKEMKEAVDLRAAQQAEANKRRVLEAAINKQAATQGVQAISKPAETENEPSAKKATIIKKTALNAVPSNPVVPTKDPQLAINNETSLISINISDVDSDCEEEKNKKKMKYPSWTSKANLHQTLVDCLYYDREVWSFTFPLKPNPTSRDLFNQSISTKRGSSVFWGSPS